MTEKISLKFEIAVWVFLVCWWCGTEKGGEGERKKLYSWHLSDFSALLCFLKKKKKRQKSVQVFFLGDTLPVLMLYFSPPFLPPRFFEVGSASLPKLSLWSFFLIFSSKCFCFCFLFSLGFFSFYFFLFLFFIVYNFSFLSFYFSNITPEGLIQTRANFWNEAKEKRIFNNHNNKI